MALMLFEVVFPVFDILPVYFETRPFYWKRNVVLLCAFVCRGVIFHLHEQNQLNFQLFRSMKFDVWVWIILLVT